MGVFFRYHDRLGVVIGETSVLLRALPVNGRTYVIYMYFTSCTGIYIFTASGNYLCKKISKFNTHNLELFIKRYACGSHGVITLQKQFSQSSVPFVYQATVKVQ